MADRSESNLTRFALLPICVVVVIGLVYGLKVAFELPATTLKTAIAADAGPTTQLELEDGKNFPGQGKIKIGHEEIEVVRITPDGFEINKGSVLLDHPNLFAIVERGVSGTEVSGHPAGAAVEQVGEMFFPENNATYGEAVDDLFFLILWITGIAFVLTEAFFLYAVIKFRATPGGRSHYTHGSHKLEMVWTIIPALILVALAILQSGMWTEIKIDMPEAGGDTIQVQVVAKQFEWNFRQPGLDGKFGTADDITDTGLMTVPAGKKVRMQIRAQDVLHSFFLPNFRLKQDAVPGMNIPSWFEAMKPGKFPIMCAELCGNSHTKMKATLMVLEEDAYRDWVQERSEEALEEHDGMDRWEWFAPASLWWWWDSNELRSAAWRRDQKAEK